MYTFYLVFFFQRCEEWEHVSENASAARTHAGHISVTGGFKFELASQRHRGHASNGKAWDLVLREPVAYFSHPRPHPWHWPWTFPSWINTAGVEIPVRWSVIVAENKHWAEGGASNGIVTAVERRWVREGAGNGNTGTAAGAGRLRFCGRVGVGRGGGRGERDCSGSGGGERIGSGTGRIGSEMGCSGTGSGSGTSSGSGTGSGSEMGCSGTWTRTGLLNGRGTLNLSVTGRFLRTETETETGTGTGTGTWTFSTRGGKTARKTGLVLPSISLSSRRSSPCFHAPGSPDRDKKSCTAQKDASAIRQTGLESEGTDDLFFIYFCNQRPVSRYSATWSISREQRARFKGVGLPP